MAEPQTCRCETRVRAAGYDMCPMHRAAPALAEALEAFETWSRLGRTGDLIALNRQARAALAQAKEGA